MKAHPPNGFTMVELLVVIAIICVLVAILMPVVWGVRNAAKLSWCQSNIGQLYRGFLAYNADFSGWFPYTKSYEFWPSQKDWMGYWAPPKHDENAPQEGTLWAYVREKKVYLCPSDNPTRTIGRMDGYATGYWYRNTVTTHSYSLHTPGVDNGRPTNISEYPTSQYPFIVGESAVTIEDGNFGSSGNIFASRHRMSASDHKSSYDSAGGNIGFLDGHVEFFHAEEIMSAASTIFSGGVTW
ncbi:type II secretion system protein [Planctomycetota bacterium]